MLTSVCLGETMVSHEKSAHYRSDTLGPHYTMVDHEPAEAKLQFARLTPFPPFIGCHVPNA